MEQLDRFRGCLLGLAAGDAVGTTVEFRPRGSFEPLVDMAGGGPFRLEPGQWTDDTSMALALATSLVEKGFDPRDQMDRYLRWWREGYLSSTGRCFDIGNTVSRALSFYESTGSPFSGSTSPHSAGNGSIMRLAPAPMYYWRDEGLALHYAAESSRTTHGATECLDACQLLAAILLKALAGADKETILLDHGAPEPLAEKIQAIADGGYRAKDRDQIKGSGYVVESLEAALWCFWTTDSYREAVLAAANLGDDADTTAAVCGQVAGAFYGAEAIPVTWREQLAMGSLIQELAERLWAGPPNTPGG